MNNKNLLNYTPGVMKASNARIIFAYVVLFVSILLSIATIFQKKDSLGLEYVLDIFIISVNFIVLLSIYLRSLHIKMKLVNDANLRSYRVVRNIFIVFMVICVPSTYFGVAKDGIWYDLYYDSNDYNDCTYAARISKLTSDLNIDYLNEECIVMKIRDKNDMNKIKELKYSELRNRAYWHLAYANKDYKICDNIPDDGHAKYNLSGNWDPSRSYCVSSVTEVLTTPEY